MPIRTANGCIRHIRMPLSEKIAWIVSRKLTCKNARYTNKHKTNGNKKNGSEMWMPRLKAQSNNQGWAATYKAKGVQDAAVGVMLLCSCLNEEVLHCRNSLRSETIIPKGKSEAKKRKTEARFVGKTEKCRKFRWNGVSDGVETGWGLTREECGLPV